jgi:hypothetical protein
MGGRFKRLARAAASDAEKRQALAKAIDCYERGMDLDLNAYYCSSNLCPASTELARERATRNARRRPCA